MSGANARLAPRPWLRLPRRTARFKLTALYGGLFITSGVALLAVTYGLFERATKFKAPRLPTIPGAISLEQLLPRGASSNLLLHPHQLVLAQRELAQAQYQLKDVPKSPSGIGFSVGPIRQLMAAAQRQLTGAEHQLVKDVHDIAQSGSLQTAQRAADSHELLVNSGIALAIVAILALLAGWLLAGRMLRPIRTITRTARRISSTSLHERLALDGPADELKELGDTLDDLFERLDVAFEAQRQFVASASHELRTPMTVERTLLQVALDNPAMTIDTWRSTAHEVLAVTEEQARLIEGLLTLATSGSALNEHRRVDLAATVKATFDELRPEIDRLGVRVDVATRPADLDGDPLLVERLVVNLFTNALRHNIVDGSVEVATDVKEGSAVLLVTNTGPYIEPADVQRLFEPFQRLDPRRANYQDGHGLGLSIVRAIVTAHEAEIVALSLPDGGLSVSVTFATRKNRHYALQSPSLEEGRVIDI